MSRSLLSVVLASVLGFTATSALAQDVNGFYVGAGYGVVKVPKDDDLKFSDAKNGYLQLGYSFNENFAAEAQYSASLTDASATLDIGTTDFTSEVKGEMLAQGASSAQVADIKSVILNNAKVNIDVAVDTFALYGVYRTSGDFYAKAKAGIVSTKLTPSASGSGQLSVAYYSTTQIETAPLDGKALAQGFDETAESETETDFSAGVGAGYKISNKFAIELEYTMINSDLDYYSLGAKYAF